jgi:hypothetical protein
MTSWDWFRTDFTSEEDVESFDRYRATHRRTARPVDRGRAEGEEEEGKPS